SAALGPGEPIGSLPCGYRPILRSSRERSPPSSGASSPLSTASAASGEARSRRLLEPVVKFLQRHVVHPFRNRRRDAVEHERLQLLPLRDLFHRNQIVHFLS